MNEKKKTERKNGQATDNDTENPYNKTVLYLFTYGY